MYSSKTGNIFRAFPAAVLQQALNTGACDRGVIVAEETEYLVVEDAYVNGRPPLNAGGVLYTDRETVDRVEKMKDEDIKGLVTKLGRIEAEVI